jgi:hypothetical protein
VGQNVQQESPQELVSRDGHLTFLVSVRIILPSEGDLITVEADQAVIGDGDAVCVYRAK